MKRTTFGPKNTDKITIIGGIHGDEPLTSAVISYLENTLKHEPLSEDIQIELITANEKALAQNQRYIDIDLNRIIKQPNKNANNHETQLATKLESQLDTAQSILTLHSSQSVPPPFSISSDITYNKDLLTALPYNNTVKDTNPGSVEAEYHTAINVEAGHQQTNQVFYNGIIAAYTFLTYHNAINLTTINHTPTTVYTTYKTLEKTHGTPKTYYKNFEQIPKGELIAEDDGIKHTATEANLTPILLSETGYQHQFGLLGKKETTLNTS